MDFGNFLVLETLSISFSLLFGWSRFPETDRQQIHDDQRVSRAGKHVLKALPKSLEVLVIDECERAEDIRPALSALDAVITRRKDQFPALRELELVVHGDEDDKLDQVKSTFELRGWAAIEDLRIEWRTTKRVEKGY